MTREQNLKKVKSFLMVKAVNTEIKLLGVFPVQKVVTELADKFRRELGHPVTADIATSGVIRQKLASGKPADIVILQDYEIKELAENGFVDINRRDDVARFGLGVVVRQGSTLPNISTVDDLKKTFSAA